MTNPQAIEAAFENGMAVQRIADVTFRHESEPIAHKIGLFFGVILALAGIFPIAKLIEGGLVANAIYGAMMIVCGIVCVAISSLAEARWQDTRDKALLENYEKVKRNLLKKSLQGSKDVDTPS
tara:strand:- start:6005 stop:6373 length:369 start_codon:yes stop_codon:yes gene_type:complete